MHLLPFWKLSKYTNNQIDAIKKYYPIGEWDKLYKVFPNMTRRQIQRIANRIGVTMNNECKIYYRRYSDEQIKELKLLYPKRDWGKLEKIFPGESHAYISHVASMHGIKADESYRKSNQKYTEHHIEALRKYYPCSDYDSLKKYFPDKTKAQIKQVANKYKIYKDQEHSGKYSQEQIDILKKYYPSGDWNMINKYFPNVDRSRIVDTANRYGLILNETTQHDVIPISSPDMIPYFECGYDEAILYTPYSAKQIYPVCPRCGKKSNRLHRISDIATYGIGCECGDGVSYPEKFFISVFNQLHEKFIYQAGKTVFSWLSNNYKYDFYFPKKNIIVEVDGIQHTKRNQKIIDKNKEILASENNIKVIRVNCYRSTMEYIINHLSNELYEYFDLDNVDFLESNKYALQNSLYVDVVNYYKETKLNNGEIAKHFGLCCATVSDYLKKAEKYGLIENYKKYRRPNMVGNIPVVAFDKYGNIFYYESISIAAKYYGVSRSSISDVLYNRCNKCCGLIWFKYKDIKDILENKENKMPRKIYELIEYIENDKNEEFYKDKHDLIIRKINEIIRAINEMNR